MRPGLTAVKKQIVEYVDGNDGRPIAYPCFDTGASLGLGYQYHQHGA